MMSLASCDQGTSTQGQLKKQPAKYAGRRDAAVVGKGRRGSSVVVSSNNSSSSISSVLYKAHHRL